MNLQPNVDQIIHSTTQLMPLSTMLYLIAIVALLVGYKRKKESKSAQFADMLAKRNLKQIPSPPALPIIGHLHLLRDYQHNHWEGFDLIRAQYGDIVRIQMGVQPMILLSSFDAMREVLLDKGDIFADRPYFPRHDIIFGGNKEHSLALCNWTDVHKARRRFCKRGVVPNNLSARNQLLENIIAKKLATFHNRLLARPSAHGPLAHQHVTELTKTDILFLTGDVFMEFLCSHSFSHDNKSYQSFNWCCDFIFWDINESMAIDVLPYLISIGVSRSYLKQLQSVTDSCRDFIERNILQPRFEEFNKRPLDQALEDHDYFNDDRYDYLDAIIREQSSGATSMTLDDYKVGFSDLLAGHGAVSNILMRTLGHLALDQKAQDLICEEYRSFKHPDLATRSQLVAAEAALLEALRFASSPIVPHVARRDTSIQGYHVPKGSTILFNCYRLNLDENLHRNPRQFDITRFLVQSQNEAGERVYKLTRPKYFFPFSMGVRQCLGFKMVETISILTITKLCAHFRFVADDPELVRQLLEPKGNLSLDPNARCYKLLLCPRSV